MGNNENKKDDGFGKGLTLIVVGVIALLITFFDFEIDWNVLGKMWPVLLIIIGVCIMPINKWIRTVIALILLAVGAVAYHQKAEVTKVDNKTEYWSKSRTRVIIENDIDDDDDFDID